MRFFKFSLLLLAAFAIVSGTVSAQGTSQKGVQVGDIDTKADPCTDFFQFANGKWRADNPIPPSMVRWSRRWKAGEDAKEQLKGILDDVSRKTDWPRGRVEELISDYYGSCMNEAAVNKLGIAPAKPMLTKIDALKTPADLQNMFRQLHDVSVFVQLAEHILQISRSLQGVNLRQHRFRRRDAQFVYGGFIHAGAIIVADEFFHAAAGPIRFG